MFVQHAGQVLVAYSDLHSLNRAEYRFLLPLLHQRAKDRIIRYD